MNWTFPGNVMVAVFGLLLAATDSPAQTPAAKPHVVILLADDMGWGDTGFHGSEIQTPHIDRLAAAGARLEQFYVQPVCSPTRAALLTGRYPMRYGLQVGVVRPWARYGLPLEERTLAQALKDAGYETAICGKWHLGHFRPEYLPTRRGFDHQYGHYNGAIDYFSHHRDGGLDWHRDDKALREEGYSTALIAQEACRVIRQRDRSKPLFLYVPFNAVHDPRQVPASYTTPYARLKEPRRTYAGMVAALDEAIGRILATLDEAGMRQDTLLIFFSDNGGPAPGRVTSNGPFRAGKGTLYEGGTRVVACTAWEGHVKPGTIVNAPLHAVDWYPTLLKLAGASPDQKLPLDGRDAWPTITQGKPSPHAEILLNSTPHNGALRVGDWKLVLNGNRADDGTSVGGDGAKESVELFNLAQDPAEKHNRAADQPDKVKDLRSRYEALARQAVAPKSAPRPADYHAPKVWGEPD